MANKVKTPNTLAHTRDMLESILRPHSLEELYALVGSFPFKAVKVVTVKVASGTEILFPVGTKITVSEYYEPNSYLTDFPNPKNGALCKTPKDLKQWRLAGDDV